MPDTYHYIPQEFRNQGEANMSPHYSDGKGAPQADQSYYECPDSSPCHSLLFHRVPSASLYLEDMLAQWSSQRSSTATLVDFGEWTSGRSHERPLSLLPPAPQLIRLPSSDSGKVECRLSSPANTESNYTQCRHQWHNLSAQLQEVSFGTDGTPSQPTRPITPVPSLTTSKYSRSSFGMLESSPCTTIGSPKDYLRNNSTDQSMTATARKPTELGSAPRLRNINSPLPSPPLYQDKSHAWISLPADPSRISSYLPSRPVPDPDLNATMINLPHSSQESQETSYIEWDDDEGRIQGDSALSRIKKSFTDLRAAERYISDANSRRKAQLAKEAHDTSNSTSAAAKPPYTDINTRHISSSSTNASIENGDTLVQLPTRLRKKPSRKCISTAAHLAPAEAKMPALLSSGIVPSTPPSTGKRKRTNTISSQQSRTTGMKKAKNSVVGKLVRRLLGAKQEH